MSQIRCIYHAAPPAFPAEDQHPEAKRYGPLQLGDGSIVFVDAIDGAPTAAEVIALLTPLQVTETAAERLVATTGLSVAELKALLALPT